MFNIGQLLAEKEITKGLPKGSSWFSLDSLTSGETAKTVKAFAGSIGTWLNAVYDSKKSIYLSTAQGTDIDLWGQDIGLARKPSESDTDYRARISAEILAKKLTAPAIKEFIEANLNIPTTIYQPWTDIAIYDYGYDSYEDDGRNLTAGLSGTKRYVSEYYTAGVIDLYTEGWDVELPGMVNKLKGAPIKPYFTPHITPGGLVQSTVSDSVSFNNYLLWITNYAVQDDLTNTNGNYGQILSGSPDNQSDTVLAMTLGSFNNFQTRLWNSPQVPNGDFRSTSATWDCLADLTWDQALAGHDRETSGFVVTKRKEPAFTLVPNGDMSTSSNWVSTSGLSNGDGSTYYDTRYVDRSTDSFYIPYVYRGNKSLSLYAISNRDPSNREITMSQTVSLTSYTTLAMAVFTGNLTTANHLGLAGGLFGATFDTVSVYLIRASDNAVIPLWSSNTANQTYNLELDISGMTGDHTIVLSAMVDGGAGKGYAHAFFDNVRLGVPGTVEGTLCDFDTYDSCYYT